MNHFTFAGNLKEQYTSAILIKAKYFKQANIKKHYVDPLVNLGVPQESIIAFDLDYPNDKVTATQAKKYLGFLLPALVKSGVSNLFVADAAYFKILTGEKKAEQHTGYVLPCKIKGFEFLNVAYSLNYGVLMHNPNQVYKLDLAVQAFAAHLNGTLVPLGEDVLLNPTYHAKTDLEALQDSLEALLHKPMISCDTETFGLTLKEGGIGSIAFAWNEREAMAAHVRHLPTESTKIFTMIKRFFERYRGTVVYHNAIFDIKHIIYNCFMKHPLDHVGMLHGLEVMTRKIHCTQIIAYLATNSTAGNELGLKVLAQPYMGNWGVDVVDITKIPVPELLEYNAGDCVATLYVFNKYYPTLIRDDQLEIYENIMLPSVKVIVQMELHGMPIDMEQVRSTEDYLSNLYADYLTSILDSQHTKNAQLLHQTNMLVEINSKLKTKVHDMTKVSGEIFNPGSSNQLALLLHDVMKLPVIDRTPTKQPATGAKVLAKLVNHTKDASKIELITAIINYSKVTKILSTFIPAFLDAHLKANGHYLHGSFKIGGTLSGRLSSHSPNMQQLPSGSTYGKVIKECFKPKPGWLFVGADFSSLTLGEQYRNVLC